MNAVLPIRMTVDEFLLWSQQQDSGRYELERGQVVLMSPQNVGHAKTKARVFSALDAAIARSGLPLYALPDGMTIRIPGARAYEPDALVAALPEPAAASLEVADPIVVIEVMSPSASSMRRDLQAKVVGYALVPSIEHYIIIDPADRVVLHYRRRGDLLVPPEVPTEGTLRLDPPGLTIPIAELLIPAGSTEVT